MSWSEVNWLLPPIQCAKISILGKNCLIQAILISTCNTVIFRCFIMKKKKQKKKQKTTFYWQLCLMHMQSGLTKFNPCPAEKIKPRPLLIFSQSGYLIQIICWYKFTFWMANSADLQKPTDLDLHCLQRQGISRLSRTRVKYSMCLKQKSQASLHSCAKCMKLKTSAGNSPFLCNPQKWKLSQNKNIAIIWYKTE